MCGIAGIIELNEKDVNEVELSLMNSFNKLRGPDADGVWTEKGIGLAHRRLSIVDLSERGIQPMVDQSKRLVITYNGEIYNFNELKDELLKLGHVFFSNTDTEVILEGYLEWGIHKLLENLDGMFAFTLFDRKNEKIYMCRDRFGKKPLYYFADSKRVSFASDIRSISAVEKKLTLNYNTIDYYLSELSAPQPYTIWNEVKQVRKASYITVDLKQRSIEEKAYWQLKNQPDYSISLNEAINTVERKLIKSIEKRGIGDEKITAFLSGGVDSGLIVALMSQNSSNRIGTYTIGVEYGPMDEQVYAEQLAKKYNTDHHSFVVKANIIEILPDLIEGYGEPFADSSSVPSYYITREMHKHSKVAMSGDGGDEIFGGYNEYSWAFNADKYSAYSTKSYWKAISFSSKILSRLNSKIPNLGHYDSYLKLSGGQKLFRQMGFNAEEKSRLYGPVMNGKITQTAEILLDRIWDDNKQETILDTLFRSSIETRLVNDYLVKVDRASMMNSLEIRSPFLDKDLAEYAFSLPGTLKLHNGTEKYILKKLAEKHIDKNIFKREKKGFGIPIAQWIRNELNGFVKDIILSDSLRKRNIFNMNYISSLLDEHCNKNVDHSDKIWAILCLELWFQKFYTE